MIQQLTDNNIMDCLLLMQKSMSDNDYVGYKSNANQRCFTEHLCLHIKEALHNPNFLANGYFEDGYLKAFMLASTFRSYYTDEMVLDVKDMIVNMDNKRKNPIYVKALFDEMIEHIKRNGGSAFRADSIREFKHAESYKRFLEKHYNAEAYISMRGRV